MDTRGPIQDKWYQQGFQDGRDVGIAVGATKSDWYRRAVIGSCAAFIGAIIFLAIGIIFALPWKQTAALVGAGSTACAFGSQFIV